MQQHATDGTKALRLDKNYATWLGPQDWSGYDYLKADLYTDAERPLELYVEIRDQLTRDYWTRVNYVTVVPPGASTLVLPLDQLYVGEKSRPGRKLMLSGVTHLVFNIGEQPPAPLYRRQPASGTRRGDAAVDVRRPARVRLRTGTRPAHARHSRASTRPPCTARAAATD